MKSRKMSRIWIARSIREAVRDVCRKKKIILARRPGLANLATRRIMKYGEIKSIRAYKTWRFITAAVFIMQFERVNAPVALFYAPLPRNRRV